MNKNLIESVRALAEAQSARGGQGVIVFPRDLSLPALLAALERAERIEKAARTLQERKEIYAKALDVLNLVPVYSKYGREMAVSAAEGAVSSAQAMLDAALSEPK